MKPKDGKPYFWATWIAKMLAGETQCVYSLLVKSRFWYEKRPSDFKVAAWKADHDRLVQSRIKELKAQGRTVTVERENKFTVEGDAAILAGQMDIVAVKDADVLISDGKTGQQKNADWWQVLIYLACAPLAFPRLKGKTFSGEVAYTNGVIEIPSTDLTAERKNQIFTTIRTYAHWNGTFPTTPSKDECAWCDIAECGVRWKEDNDSVAITQEF